LIDIFGTALAAAKQPEGAIPAKETRVYASGLIWLNFPVTAFAL